MSKLGNKEAVQKYYKKNSVKLNQQRVAQKAFSRMILNHDPICIVIGCNNRSCSAHHIIYKSQWRKLFEALYGFGRDDLKNGAGLCAEHDYKFHNGEGLHGMSGREYAFTKLSEHVKGTSNYIRWYEVISELKKSLIRKGIVI